MGLWILKKEFQRINKRIADLEEEVQSQRSKINLLICQDRPAKALNDALGSAQCYPNLTFQVDSDNEPLFLQKHEQNNE